MAAPHTHVIVLLTENEKVIDLLYNLLARRIDLEVTYSPVFQEQRDFWNKLNRIKTSRQIISAPSWNIEKIIPGG